MKPLLKSQLNHVPLESYRQRYSDHLASWEYEAFSKQFEVKTINPVGSVTHTDIKFGSVLDQYQRPEWCIGQISSLLRERKNTNLGNVYFSDFYHTGLDALAYAKLHFRAYSFLWAQTFDVYDFTYRDHFKWMRPWEAMAFNIYHKVFVACPELAELITVCDPRLAEKVIVTGLPFNSDKVYSLLTPEKIAHEEFDVVYSSRWDQEKQPGFFLDLVVKRDDLKFAVCTGWDELRGNDDAAIRRAKHLADKGRLRIFKGCDKPAYYGVLAASKVQFNCALQDWVSFTLLEALTFGCHPLYPNHRSFPAVFNYDQAHLYIPFYVDDASHRLSGLIERPRYWSHGQHILNTHNESLNHIADVIRSDEQ